MNENEFKQVKMKEFDRIEDLKNLATSAEVMFYEREDKTLKDQNQKQLYKKAWMEQMKIKQQERLIKNELLTGE